jgi:hypothetical protein
MDKEAIVIQAAKWHAVYEFLQANPTASIDTIASAFPWISTSAAAPPPSQTPFAPAPAYAPPTAVAGELVSCRLCDVTGLRRAGCAPTMYTGEHAAIVPPTGAPPTAAVLRAVNRDFGYSDAKLLLAASVRDAWPAVRSYFSLQDWQQERFVALMMGQATRESTLAVDIETGKAKGYNLDSAHAYGLLQTAVTGFRGSNPNYDQEDDVPELHWYEFTPEHFYDALISNFTGLRKMCHFAAQARSKYTVSDPWEVIRLSLQAHNTGHANPGNDEGYMADYPDMCARMGEFYFKNGHMVDDVFTWTGNYEGHATSYPATARGAAWRENWTWFWTQ